MMKVKDAEELVKLGRDHGARLRGGEMIELIGDVGAGKTTFTQGLAQGLGVTGPVNSPSFTIMKSYTGRDGLTLHHYDFYRINDVGIMRNEIVESLADPHNITVVEWGENVRDVLPDDRQTIEIKYTPDGHRELVFATSDSTRGKQSRGRDK